MGNFAVFSQITLTPACEGSLPIILVYLQGMEGVVERLWRIPRIIIAHPALQAYGVVLSPTLEY